MRLRLGPLQFAISRTAQQRAAGGDLITSIPPSRGGWWPIVRESFAGAWQRSIAVPIADALTHPTFFSCVTLVAGDIAKMRIKLVKEDPDTGIQTETPNPAYSPVLRKPNHYQNRIQFIQYWVLSKLCHGNAYALKVRDARNVVTDLYLLDPTRVRPMVAPTGDVYYALYQDQLSGIDAASIVVPAREIIHDPMYAIYHPLVGLSPVFASGHAAIQSLTIMRNTTKFAENGALIGGLLVAPGAISPDTAKRLEDHFNNNYAGAANVGKIAAIGDGLKFEKPPIMSAVDGQIIDQLKWGDEKICATFHVPAYMVGVGPAPNYNNIESLSTGYYSQCLQILIESLELSLDEGLGMDLGLYSAEFDLDGLMRMDSVQQMEVATKGVIGGILKPNEGRKRFNLPPVEGGNTPYLQQQNYSLAALAKRDAAAPAPHSSAPGAAPGGAPPAEPKPAAPVPAVAVPPTKDIEADEVDHAELLVGVMRSLEAAVA